nr:uncharacterized protein LOC118969444 [Manis javanica]
MRAVGTPLSLLGPSLTRGCAEEVGADTERPPPQHGIHPIQRSGEQEVGIRLGSRRGKRKGRARLAPAPPPSRGAPAWVEGGTASPSHFLSSRSSPPPVASSPSFLSRGPPVPRAGAEDRPTLRADGGADRTLSSGLQLENFEHPGASGAVGVKDTLLVIPRRTTALQRLLPARHREAWLTKSHSILMTAVTLGSADAPPTTPGSRKSPFISQCSVAP